MHACVAGKRVDQRDDDDYDDDGKQNIIVTGANAFLYAAFFSVVEKTTVLS